MPKKYLIVGISYHHIAIPYETGEQLAQLIAAVSETRQVESKGYGDDQRFVPTTDNPVQFQLVDAKKVAIGDDLASLKARLDEATKEAADNNKRWLDQHSRNQKLEAELKALKASPTPANPVASPDEDLPL